MSTSIDWRLTAQSRARWANAIIAGNDTQYRLARDAAHRHLIGLRAAIATIEKRLAAATADTLSLEQRRTRPVCGLGQGDVRYGIGTIAVEDLDFADVRGTDQALVHLRRPDARGCRGARHDRCRPGVTSRNA